MARRVSMKGKGADLFFSGDLNLVPAAEDHVTEPSSPALNDVPSPVVTITEAPATGDDAPSTTTETPALPPTARRQPRRRSTTTPDADDDVPPEDDAPAPPDVIELIRKTVKHPGREVSFVRLTPEEKGRLADVVYTYKRQGVKTSENEINRIAVHYMLHDYYEHGEASVLARVIAALRA